MRSRSILAAPTSNDWCPQKEKETQRHAEESQVKTWAEMGVIDLYTNEPQSLQRQHGPADTFILHF